VIARGRVIARDMLGEQTLPLRGPGPGPGTGD